MTVASYDVHVEARNVEVKAEWHHAISCALERFGSHFEAPVLQARLALIASPDGRRGLFEVRLVLDLCSKTVAVKQRGRDMVGLIDEAFDSARCEMQAFNMVRQAPPEPGVHRGRVRWFSSRRNTGCIDAGVVGDVYFHTHAVCDEKGPPEAGSCVEFALDEGDRSRQASWVRTVHQEPVGETIR